MFWLARPPYLRWALAALVVLAGLIVELRPATTVPHPFTTTAVQMGDTIDETSVVWRDVPIGLLPPVSLPAVAPRALDAGEPVPAGTAVSGSGVPPGWWALELPVPAGAAPGMDVRVVTDGVVTDGAVVRLATGDFGGTTALVAIPEAASTDVASAARDGSVTVLLGG